MSIFARYLIAFILLWKLNGKVLLMSPDVDGRRIVHYLKSGTCLGNSIYTVCLHYFCFNDCFLHLEEYFSHD